MKRDNAVAAESGVTRKGDPRCTRPTWKGWVGGQIASVSLIVLLSLLSYAFGLQGHAFRLVLVLGAVVAASPGCRVTLDRHRRRLWKKVVRADYCVCLRCAYVLTGLPETYVCPECGLYAEHKEIRERAGADPLALCPHCGYGHPFRQLPFFVLTGASGAGKTAVCLELVGAQLRGEPWVPDCVYLEGDILWRDEFADPENGYRAFRNLWLRVAKNVGQGGRPVFLCGSTVPEQYEACPERRYFTTIHFLALICDDRVLRERLEARPGWRRSGSMAFLEQMVAFNRWFCEHAQDTEPSIHSQPVP